MALGLTPTTLSFIQGNGSPAPSAGVTDVLQNGSSVVDNGVARVTVPVKTSDLQNDSGFITSSDIPAIPTKTSDLQNDSGFITSSSLPTVDQTYNAASANAQSGVAVAQAIAGITPGGNNLYVPSDWLENDTSVWNQRPDSARVKSENLPTVADFIIANNSSTIIATVFAAPVGGNITTFPPRVVPFQLQISYVDSEDVSRVGRANISIPMGFSAKDVGTYFGGSGARPISPLYKGVTSITNIQVENYTVGITDVSEALPYGILFTVIK